MAQQMKRQSTYPHLISGIGRDVVEIVEPAKEGYQLTLRLDFSEIPNGKDSVKVIADIAAVQAVILSSQLKEMLMNVNPQDTSQGMYKPLKLEYHPREPFFIIRQPQKIIAVFPIRFKDKTDVIIATVSLDIYLKQYHLTSIFVKQLYYTS
ncbi:actin-related protein 2/3 complex subunit 2B-like [Pyrus x bretschneideri]|uniref:actin-related protein 2/3 complex subunit 2B-like n=1 Tax=Pyrus x bretschneideri TaxID=225117 RepID=UPI00202F7DAC|nr:actin-related protein 2/3 complex subunit 2B-like [Pyrus x bretschneideri]